MSRPTPTSLKLINGNPGKRPINTSEPTPARGYPNCPALVANEKTGEAKREWDRITEELDQMGLLTTVDRPALTMYCVTWARWIEAETLMQSSGGMLIPAPKTSTPMQNYYLSIANTAQEKCLKLLQEFGLTPAARTKVHVVPETNKGDDFFETR